MKGVFIPETWLPKYPRVVDEEEYPRKMENLDDTEKEYLEVTKAKNAWKGDVVEFKLSKDLKDYFENEEVVVLQGPVFQTPGAPQGDTEEHDFLIIIKKLKVILCMESKSTLSKKTALESSLQLEGMKKIVEDYLGGKLISEEWYFIPLVHFVTCHSEPHVCPDCKDFTIQQDKDKIVIRRKLNII